MAREIVYIVRPGKQITSFPKGEVLDCLGIAEDKLTLLKSSGLIVTEMRGNQETFSQDTVDQIHNILVLEQLFSIEPKAIRSLYNVFDGYVSSLPVKDTDLYKYSNAELNSDSAAARDILKLTLKKIFCYLRQLDNVNKTIDSLSSRPFVIRMKQE